MMPAIGVDAPPMNGGAPGLTIPNLARLTKLGGGPGANTAHRDWWGRPRQVARVGSGGRPAAQMAVKAALSKLGRPLHVGSQPDAFDCSGLIKWSYAQAGVTLGPDTYAQIKQGEPVAPGDVDTGDMVLSTDSWNGKGPGHAMLAISPIQVIEAQQTGVPVKQSRRCPRSSSPADPRPRNGYPASAAAGQRRHGVVLNDPPRAGRLAAISVSNCNSCAFQFPQRLDRSPDPPERGVPECPCTSLPRQPPRLRSPAGALPAGTAAAGGFRLGPPRAPRWGRPPPGMWLGRGGGSPRRGAQGYLAATRALPSSFARSAAGGKPEFRGFARGCDRWVLDAVGSVLSFCRARFE